MKRASLVLLLVAGACGESIRFTRTDPTFAAAPSSKRPEVYIDHAPPAPYRKVGLVTLDVREGTPTHDVVDRAAEKGQANGCDIVVANPLLDPSAVSFLPRIRLAHGGGGSEGEWPRGSASGSHGDATIHYEFICGVH